MIGQTAQFTCPMSRNCRRIPLASCNIPVQRYKLLVKLLPNMQNMEGQTRPSCEEQIFYGLLKLIL